MKNETLLNVEGLHKHYDGTPAVDNISFSVHKGEVFGLLGPNGAGKTTTIRMLCGLIKSNGGKITVNGIPMSTGYQQIKSMIGLCPQEIIIWEQLTCLEQLQFMGTSYGMSAKQAVQKSEQLLQTLGLKDKKNKLAGTLSGGMQRRLNIALALVHDPQLIILDEPQAGLDPQSRILVRDFIRQMADQKTIILTTHDMDEADRLSDRVAIIDHGKILVIDTPDKLKQLSGAGDILQISIGETTQSQIDSLLRSLPPTFTERTYADGLLLLGSNDIVEQIPLVSNLLTRCGIRLNNMTIRKRTLEDAFIAITGRGLRQ